MERIGSRFYKKLLLEFLGLLKEEFRKRLVSVVLYGSIARGEGKKRSDIDLLLILEDPELNYHRRLDHILDLAERLKTSKAYMKQIEKVGNEPYFSFLILSRKEAQENRYLFLDMIDDAQILYDQKGFFAKRLHQMKKRLQGLGSQKILLKNGSWYWDLKPDLRAGDEFTL